MESMAPPMKSRISEIEARNCQSMEIVSRGKLRQFLDVTEDEELRE
jgi:hypothetical protein